MTDTQPDTSTARSDGELRCFPCCVNNHHGCKQAPCQCAARGHRLPGEWPTQTDGDPFDLTMGDQP